MQLENEKAWQKLSYEFIDTYQQQWGCEDPASRLTIGLNTLRGKNFLKTLDPTLSSDNHTVFLFLLSKGTETLHTYLDSDFAIVAYIVECEESSDVATKAEAND